MTAGRTGSDAGAGTIIVLVAASVLVLVAMVLTSLAAVGVARHRAASVADLAALAAASSSHLGGGAACAAAAEIAQRSAARLVDCRLVGDRAEVVASVRPPGRLGELGAASARAHAGPAQGRSPPPPAGG